MSKSNLHETAYLKLVFQNIAHANIGDVAGLRPSTTAGSLWVALYTSDPGEGDAGVEANYTGYARVAVARSAVGWTVTNDTCANAATVTFPISTGGVNNITHFGIRTAASSGDLIGSGSLSGTVTVNSGDTPKFNPGSITIIEQ